MPAKVQMLRSSLVKSRSPRESNLEVRNLKSVVSDGARIMTGEYSGVAAPLRRINKVMPKITSIFTKVQTELQNLALTDNTKTFCQKKKACHTRWLSLEQSVNSVFLIYVALLRTIKS